MKTEEMYSAIRRGADTQYLLDAAPGVYAEERKKKRAAVRTVGTAAACLCFVLGIGIFSAWSIAQNREEPPVHAGTTDIADTEDSAPETDDPTATEPITQPDAEEKILWSEASEKPMEEIQQEGNYLIFFNGIKNLIDTAEDNDKIAFSVIVYTDEIQTGDDFREAGEALMEAENKVEQIFNEKIEAGIKSGMSEPEATVRAYNAKEYLSAMEEAKKANAKKELLWGTYRYRAGEKTLEVLEDLGFEKLYDATDPTYLPFFSRSATIAVFTGTKAQIMALKEETLPWKIGLKEAYENAAEMTDPYGMNTNPTLRDGEKITDELYRAFEESENGVVRALVRWGYMGEEYREREKWEWEAMALKEIGVRSVDDLVTAEMTDAFLEALRRLQTHADVMEKEMARIFRADEKPEYDSLYGGFWADLTLERAKEIAALPQIAYLHADMRDAARENQMFIAECE